MKQQYNLSTLKWTLSGWTPHLWRMQRTMEIGASPNAEVLGIPAKVPGSVQYSLREAGLIPDWNEGLNHRECEWVENRHWIYETIIPDEWLEPGKTIRLNCRGLDYCGCIMLNGEMVGDFVGSHMPHIFDLTPHIKEHDNVLRIVFELAPRWLGQFGYTSQMKEWKPRFNYTWDWTPRIVQIGIWDEILLEITDGREIKSFRCNTDADFQSSTGILEMKIQADARDNDCLRLSLERNGEVIRKEEILISQTKAIEIVWRNIPIELWWPNLEGDQPLYNVRCVLLDSNRNELDSVVRRVGFRKIEWKPCEDATPEADPWICVVNGRPVFLQGANWVPPLPNFADVKPDDYRKLLELYKDLGANILRVWGGAILEREYFYDMCDELGLMVWQEFPLSSSGVESWPPEDDKSIEEMVSIARSYIERRSHHVSLIIWCGGNELQGSLDGSKTGSGKPCDCEHPMLRRLQEVVKEEDPNRRFLPTSSSGPRFYCDPNNVGKGLHWDVHGPWKATGDLDQGWTDYWSKNDALFCSETGAPSASAAHIIKRWAGKFNPMPATHENPLWRRTSTWWIEWDEFVREIGREPNSLEEYVDWSQERQAKALSIAAKSCKERFPKCGGIIIWMGHDCFPCTANTSIIDFERNPKPAALALKKIWRED